MSDILEEFKTLGMKASFHYADDTASGEWRLGVFEESAAVQLFDDHPNLQNQMREIAKGFLWSLDGERAEA